MEILLRPDWGERGSTFVGVTGGDVGTQKPKIVYDCSWESQVLLSMTSAGPHTRPVAMYYSLTAGPVDFMLLDSENDIHTADIDQRQLELPTSTINRTSHPSLTDLQHRALYMTGDDPMIVILRGQVDPPQ